MDGDGRIAELDGVHRQVVDLATRLLERLRDGRLRELEVREGGIRVKVSADPAEPIAPAPAAPASAASTVPSVAPERAATPAAAGAKTVSAPLTGIFYRSASPQSPPFVQAGAVVNVGDVIGLIEAMKLFNEVRSTVAGRVQRIVAEHGQLIRAHQPILEVE